MIYFRSFYQTNWLKYLVIASMRISPMDEEFHKSYLELLQKQINTIKTEIKV